MGKAKDFFEVSKFTKALAKLLDSLPSDSEKRELDAHFVRIVEFLSELRTRLELLPSREDAESTSRSLKAVDDLIARSELNGGLRAVLGLKPPSIPKRKPVVLNDLDSARARTQITELELLPIDEIRRTLNDENRYSARDLQAVARHMGIRTRDQTGRGTLVQQIATKISNFRGYQDLGKVGNSLLEKGENSQPESGKSEK